MRTTLRLAALGVLLGGVVFWLFGGPNLGWTKTRVPIIQKDPITEQEYPVWQENFVPGVDFVGGCLALAGVVFAASACVRAKPAARTEVLSGPEPARVNDTE